MAKSYDATTRHLIGIDPAAWLACAGIEATGPVRVVTADVSTVTAEADAILAVGDPVEFLVHIEFQSSRDRTLPLRLLRYNVLAHYHHRVPVRSVAVLLRTAADSPELTGHYRSTHPGGPTTLEFWYDVVRVWELNPEVLLNGGLGTLPLALLTRPALQDPTPVLLQIQARLNRGVDPAESAELWSATKILMGLCFDTDMLRRLLMGSGALRESWVYQEILAEGRAEALAEAEAKIRRDLMAHQRQTILTLGRRRFGDPAPAIIDRLEAVDTLERLDRITERILDATSWDDLLAPPG